jgi:hypothetical protein
MKAKEKVITETKQERNGEIRYQRIINKKKHRYKTVTERNEKKRLSITKQRANE